MRVRLFGFLLALLLVGSGIAFAQSQPYGIDLNPSGLSKIYPPFDTEGWLLTRGSGQVTHQGDDYFAQDWSRNCFSQGQRLYAGISGSLLINPVGDGVQDSYGNTVLIVDYLSGFALRYAHLANISPKVHSGDLVLAGDYLGTVGATGNVVPSSDCKNAGGVGAHAHIVLYKNVPKINGRPLITNITSGGPSSFAAQFSYVAPAPLIKSVESPAVFVFPYGTKIPVTTFVFGNRGWNFDRNRVLFDPVNLLPAEAINGLPKSNWLAPPRNGTLVKSLTNETVFLIQDGMRKGLPYDVFVCRGFDFARVTSLLDSEVESYQPMGRVPVAKGCVDEAHQAVVDITAAAHLDGRFGGMQLGTYSVDFLWHPNWELRWFVFAFSGNKQTSLFHITLKEDPSIRYTIFWDPDNYNWRSWTRMF